MAIKAKDKEFRLPKISYLDYKQIAIDRTLLNLFPRLKWNGYPGRVQRTDLLTIEAFVDEFTDEKNRDRFRNFADQKDVVRKWLETDLLDLVNRGKPTQAVVSPRPLHGNTYKFRNSRHAKDYGTSEQVYWMLYHAREGRGQAALDALKRFIFAGLNVQTDKIQPSAMIDVETQAILNLDEQVQKDARDDSKPPDVYPPICIRFSDHMAEDVLRLLAYEQHIPRSVLVDYLKILLSFHLALYHLYVFKSLPELVRQPRKLMCTSESCPLAQSGVSGGTCPTRTAVVVDMGDPRNAHMAGLARRSAEAYYQGITNYIQAQFVIKKLDEMANYLVKINKISKPARGYFSVRELLEFLTPEYASTVDQYFGARLASLVEDLAEDDDGSSDPEIKRLKDLGLNDFETYIELLVGLRSKLVHKPNIITCLDSMLMKNSDSGLLRGGRTAGAPRRFVLGSRLLEVLLQVAVVVPQGAVFTTRELRIDQLLTFLRERYGLYIDRLPSDNDFGQPTILDHQALRRNVEAFKTRLREIGFFQDLSDAYVTQTVLPRYTIESTV